MYLKDYASHFLNSYRIKQFKGLYVLLQEIFKKAQEGTWITGGGLVMPCKYILLGEKEYKRQTREMLKNAASKLQ